MVARYVPRAGDLIWLDFDPQAGREQAKRRPALVIFWMQPTTRPQDWCLSTDQPS